MTCCKCLKPGISFTESLEIWKPTEMEVSVFLLRNGSEFCLFHSVQLIVLTDYKSYTRKQFMQSTCENNGAIRTACLILQWWWTVAPGRWQPQSFTSQIFTVSDAHRGNRYTRFHCLCWISLFFCLFLNFSLNSLLIFMNTFRWIHWSKMFLFVVKIRI